MAVLHLSDREQARSVHLCLLVLAQLSCRKLPSQRSPSLDGIELPAIVVNISRIGFRCPLPGRPRQRPSQKPPTTGRAIATTSPISSALLPTCSQRVGHAFTA